MSAPNQLYVDALRGNRGLVEGLIGLEAVTRAVRLLMLRDLNATISAYADSWRSQDLALQQLGLDSGIGEIEVELLDPSHLHEGGHESLITSPPEFFPNVSVIAYQTTPSASSEFGDQVDSNVIYIAIETMVKAGPVARGTELAFESIVHRRIQRTTEAVNAVMRRDPMLFGTVAPIQEPPKGGIGELSWIRTAETGSPGPRYIWQGSRLQYTAQRPSSFN